MPHSFCTKFNVLEYQWTFILTFLDTDFNQRSDDIEFRIQYPFIIYARYRLIIRRRYIQQPYLFSNSYSFGLKKCFHRLNDGKFKV